MPYRLAAAAATALLGLTIAAGTAYADDPPVRGTAACDDVISAALPLDLDVIAATNVATPLVEAAQLPDATDEQKDAAKTASDELDTVTARVQAALALSLCVAAPVETTDPTSEPTPTMEPTTTTPDPVDAVEARIARIRVLIAAIECGPDFGATNGAALDALAATDVPLTAEQRGALSDDYNARLQAINFCAGATPTTTVPVTVDPTADDGSVANTSGTQVTVVPEGSVSTGAL